MVYIATAGWSIPRPVVDRFPGAGSHLERYPQVLRCTEINSTFKHEHRPSTYARRAAATPPVVPLRGEAAPWHHACPGAGRRHPAMAALLAD